MNPKVREHWEKALIALKTANNHFENGETDSEVKKELFSALFYGQFALEALGEGDASVGVLFDALEDIKQLRSKEAIDKTQGTLNEYRRLVPEEYYLPEAIL